MSHSKSQSIRFNPREIPWFRGFNRWPRRRDRWSWRKCPWSGGSARATCWRSSSGPAWYPADPKMTEMWLRMEGDYIDMGIHLDMLLIDQFLFFRSMKLNYSAFARDRTEIYSRIYNQAWSKWDNVRITEVCDWVCNGIHSQLDMTWLFLKTGDFLSIL